MRKHQFRFGRLLLATLATGLIASAFFEARAQEIRSIDKLVKRIDGVIRTKRKPDSVFADLPKGSAPRWRKFSSAKALETYRLRNEVYSIFYNYHDRGRIALAVLTVSSQSGDWVNYVNYYFRADGTIAKIASEYRTFVGDYVALRNIYFDRKGKVLRRTVRYLTLRGRVSTKPTADELRDNGPMMRITIYASVRKLPFAKLIRPRK